MTHESGWRSDALALAAASACSAPAEVTAGGLATYEPVGEGGDSAELAGTLALSGGCVVVDGEGGITVPIFPAGLTGWNGDELRLGRITAQIGDEVSLGGGYVSRSVAEDSVPPECLLGDYFIVSQEMGR